MDGTGRSSPGHRAPHTGRRGAVRAAALLAIVLAAGAGVYARLSADAPPPAASRADPPVRRVVAADAAGDAAQSPPRVAETSPRVAFDVLAGLPEDLRAALTASEPFVERTFRAGVAVSPAEICTAMGRAGLANDGWSERGGEWRCESGLVPVAPAAGGAPSTLYFSARGPAEDRLAVIRFKLNLDDPETAREGYAALLGALDRLAGPLAWSFPADAVAAVRGHRRLSGHDRGVTIEVHPETGEVRRVNVVLILERPFAPLPADRFVPRAPAPAGE